MAIFYTLLVCALFAMTSSAIPFNEINLKIIYDPEISELIEDTVRFREEQVNQLVSGATNKTLSSAAFVDKASELIVVLQGVLSDGSETREKYESIISKEKRLTFQNVTRELKGAVITISQNMEVLSKNSNFGSLDKIKAIHIIHNTLHSILYKFYEKESAFRKHSLFVIQPIFALTSFIAFFDHIEEMLIPNIARKSSVSCTLNNILTEFSSIVVFDRLKVVNLTVIEYVLVTGYTDVVKKTDNELIDILKRPYNQYGYNQTNSSTVQCGQICVDDRENGDYCLRDIWTGVSFDAGSNKRTRHRCVLGYLELVRHRVEQTFANMLNLSNGICMEERCQKEQRTGYGYLTTTILRVNSTLLDDGTECDKTNSCDPYVKLYVDGRHVYTTKTVLNDPAAVFLETYRSQKILKPSVIIFEVWDEDGGFHGADDLIFIISINFDDLTNGTFNQGTRTIETKSIWMPEYLYD